MANTNYFNNADLFNKLPPPYYLDRSHHTGTQAISTIDGLQAILDASTGTAATRAWVMEQDYNVDVSLTTYTNQQINNLQNYVIQLDSSLVAYTNSFIKSASLGPTLYWNGSYFNVSDYVSKTYVDGSFGRVFREASFGNSFYWSAGYLYTYADVTKLYVDNSLARYIRSASTGAGLYWNAVTHLLDVSINSVDYSYIDGSLAQYVKSSSTGYGLTWDGGYVNVDASILSTKSYLTYFDSTGIGQFYISASTHHVGANFSVSVFESTGGGFEPLYPNIFIDETGNLTLTWIPGSISGQVNVLLFGAGIPSAIDNSVYATIDMIRMYLKESSIGTGFKWNAGYLDVSAIGDVTKEYVDSSLATLKLYVDGSFALKADVNSSLGLYVQKSGDTMSGNLVIDASLWVPYIYGSTAAAGNLILNSTTAASKGVIYVGEGGSVSLAGKVWTQSTGHRPQNDNDIPLGLSHKRWTTIYGRNLDISTYATIADIEFKDGSISLQNKNIIGLATPINSSDAVNKYYVDSSFATYLPTVNASDYFVSKYDTDVQLPGNLTIQGRLNMGYGIIIQQNNSTALPSAVGFTIVGDRAGNSLTTGNNNTFIGKDAGYTDLTGTENVLIGYYAGRQVRGSGHTSIGSNAGGAAALQDTNFSTAIGYYALAGNRALNTAVGAYAGLSLTFGSHNTLVGAYSAYSTSTSYSANYNSFFGSYTGYKNIDGSMNTYLGAFAGYETSTGMGNVFLGYSAGGKETGSNKLYIANSSTNMPLIYGQFNEYLIINASLGVGKIPSYTLDVSGNANVSGAFTAATKSFLIPHPTKSGMKLQYGSFEGPEFGVYVRGRLYNTDIIDLPEYWKMLVDENSITVNITPKKAQLIYVKKIENNKVYISKIGLGKIDCYYTVFGERKDVEKLIVEK